MDSTFICGCGCNLEFYNSNSGFDIYVIDKTLNKINLLISENKMVSNNKWRDFIPNNIGKDDKWWSDSQMILQTFDEFIKFVTKHKDEHIVYQHLFNCYSKYNYTNTKLSYEYIY